MSQVCLLYTASGNNGRVKYLIYTPNPGAQLQVIKAGSWQRRESGNCNGRWSSYHNIWMMNQTASKCVVMLLTQGFLPSPCPVGPEGDTERRGRGFCTTLLPVCNEICCLFSIQRCSSFSFYLRSLAILCFVCPPYVVFRTLGSNSCFNKILIEASTGREYEFGGPTETLT